MKHLKIEIPENHIIDLEKSDFSKGVIIFKNLGRSKNWEEFCENNTCTENEYYINNDSRILNATMPHMRSCIYDCNFLPSRRYAEAFMSLMQLITIRDKEYTNGWEYDYNGDQGGYCIINYANKVQLTNLVFNNAPLSFPNKELAKEFFDTWKTLIEVAKPLL